MSGNHECLFHSLYGNSAILAPSGESELEVQEFEVCPRISVVSYGINPIVFTPNFSQKYPLHGIYTHPLPLYKPTQ